MTYTIYRIMPEYCQVTDAAIGNSALPAMTGFPEAWLDQAHETCAHFNQVHESADFHFVVAEHGGPFTKCVIAEDEAAPEIPW